MRLRSSARCVVLLAGLLAAAGHGAMAQQPASGPPAPEQVQATVDVVRKDPLLGGTRIERKLHWKEDRPDPKEPDEKRPDMGWLREAVIWLAQSARVLMWVLGATAVAILLVLLRRWALLHADGVRGRPITLPSHVRDLDIRPESLPDDIAAAARALWQRGEQRACLSLLYRGALSRLVHGHAVPIRAASTEGECVRLAARALPAEGGGFFERLVQAWLLSVYGARAPDEAAVLTLCDEFDTRLPARAPNAEAPA